jgi:hypothetical protein
VKLWGPFPTTGETVAEIIMLLEKPLRLVRVRLDVADVPLLRLMTEGLALMEKSGGGA